MNQCLVNILNLMNWCLTHRCTVMNQCLVNILNLMNWCLNTPVYCIEPVFGDYFFYSNELVFGEYFYCNKLVFSEYFESNELVLRHRMPH